MAGSVSCSRCGHALSRVHVEALPVRAEEEIADSKALALIDPALRQMVRPIV
jgi:hypothetical protein